MQRRYAQFNPKRKLLTPAQALARAEELSTLAGRARYGGNPEHKKNPGDFGLTPPSDPRQGKSLCDIAKIFKRDEAKDLLCAGLRYPMPETDPLSQEVIRRWELLNG